MADDTSLRREERKDVDWIAVIRLADGSDYPCTVKDVSPSGLRICVPENQDLPEAFMIKVVGLQLVFGVKLTWRRKHFVGVAIEKIAKLPEQKPQVPDAARRATAETGYQRLGTHRRFGGTP